MGGGGSLRVGQGSGWTIPSGPTSGNLGRERSRPHAPCRSITGEEELGGRPRGSRPGGEEGDRLELQGEALASASGQASRCGDPGLFELK